MGVVPAGVAPADFGVLQDRSESGSLPVAEPVPGTCGRPFAVVEFHPVGETADVQDRPMQVGRPRQAQVCLQPGAEIKMGVLGLGGLQTWIRTCFTGM